MLVTSFRLKKIENPTNRLVAKCTLTFDAMLAVSDIKILIKEDGEYYMGMKQAEQMDGVIFNGEIKQGHGKVSLLQQDIEDFAIETL